MDSINVKLNIDKCFSVSFGLPAITQPPFYAICGSSIPCKAVFSDLGLSVHSPINFNNHINTVVSKAFAKLGLINKIFKAKNSRNVVNLYKAFVRPKLEYLAIIWSPYTQSSIDNIERVQRRMCRLIPDVRHFPYKVQLQSLGLLSLRARRLMLQLLTLFKIHKGMTKVNFNDFFQFLDSSRTRGHSCRILPKFSSHNYRLHFFSVSVITYWNQLSQDDINVTSVASFKNRLKLFFKRHDIW